MLNVSEQLPKGWTLVDQDHEGNLVLFVAGTEVLPAGEIASIELDLQDGINVASIQAQVMSADGTVSDLGTVKITEIPGEYVLEPNYPNPFNPSTQIRYALPEASEVELIVYDQLGHEIRRLVTGRQEAGYHTVTFEASNLASGMYIYRLRAGDFVMVRRMLLVK